MSQVMELFADDPLAVRAEAESLPKLNINKVDLQWLQVR